MAAAAWMEMPAWAGMTESSHSLRVMPADSRENPAYWYSSCGERSSTDSAARRCRAVPEKSLGFLPEKEVGRSQIHEKK